MRDALYLKEGKIDTSEEGIKYWSNKLNCSVTDLENSIFKIGNTYSILILYMEMNNLINRR